MTFPNIAVMCLVPVKKKNLSLKVRRMVGSSGEVIIYLRYSAMLRQLQYQEIISHSRITTSTLNTIIAQTNNSMI